MPVYERTPQGQFAAYDTGSPLPRKLRSLLKVVDGKTEADVYVATLETFGDVPKLLDSLELAGLIRVVQAGMQTSAPPPETPRPARKPNFLARLTGQSSPAPLDGDRAQGPTTEFSAPTTQPATLIDVANPDTQAFANTRSRATDDSKRSARQVALARCVDEMSSFVLAHVPQHAFMVLKELEQVSNLEQLAVTLGGYEQIVIEAGPVATEHISHVKQIMREHW